jgi:nanoRNase/pAp phosphatase (c-di-AMP/oligoRNAs hydrolase)
MFVVQYKEYLVNIEEVVAQMGLVLGSLPDAECRIVFTQFDPDAVGSAVALKAILEHHFKRRVTILYCGAIGHPQNLFLCTRYNLKQLVVPIQSAPVACDGVTILVDSCSTTDKRIPQGLVLKPRMVFDHHVEDNGRVDRDGLVWIDNVGATAVLITELAQHLCPEVLADPLVALLLSLGIYTDTKSLKHTRKRDRLAYDIVCSNASETELTEAINYRVRESYFLQLTKAVRGWRRQGGKLVTGIGVVPADEGDHVSVVADELIRMEGITFVVVWVIVDGVVRISARSLGSTIDLNEFLKNCFGNGGGKIGPDGRGEGGAIMEMSLHKMFHDIRSRRVMEKMVRTTLSNAVLAV